MKTNKMNVVGWIMTVVPSLLFVFSAVMKLSQKPEVVEGFAKFGIPAGLIVPLGILELVCTIVYLIPATTVIGAILLTGYIGGAIITHVRIGDSVMLHVAIGIVIWGGAFLRDSRLRNLIPIRR